MRALTTTLGLSICLPLNAFAHASTTTAQFDGEGLLLGLLFFVLAIYALGYARIWSASRAGRHSLVKQGLLFFSGWLVMAASLLSPLHRLGGQSFTAHMIEHELLMLLAAPLIALAKPMGVLLWSLPRATRLRLAKLSHGRRFSAAWTSLSSPLGASLIQAAMLWLWHAPVLFDRALANEGWHAAQHLSLVFSALLFWWSMHQAAIARGQHGSAVLYLFLTSMQSGLLGAVMTFANSPWYAQYAQMGLGGIGGLSPLEDQQVAGLIMWIPGGAVHALAALLYLGLSFRKQPQTQMALN
jgi:cytochrome c oxidase assembly factor CtaG